MKIKSDWKTVLFRAWSSQIMWLMLVASLLTGLEALLPIAWEFGLIELPGWVFPLLTFLVVMLALFARLLVQTGISHE